MRSRNSVGMNDLWAITTYFNPMRYRRRLANFKLFRSRLNVPLIVVELAYDADFELQQQDAEILISLRGGAVLWQKERLLNLAFQALPSHCRKVAWLDCDILFEAPDWVDAANNLLDQFAIVQLFKRVHYLSAYWPSTKRSAMEVEFSRPSAAFSLVSGVPPQTCVGHHLNVREGTSACGFAWAGQLNLLKRHGLFDACILGGGDRALACAATCCLEEFMYRHCMNDPQKARYIDWAKPFYNDVRANIAFLDQDIFHLWHGDVAKRQTRARHKGLRRFQFDPYADIEVGMNGAWSWSTNKHQMHDYVRSYFASRREDG
jgi:hypothetical protein